MLDTIVNEIGTIIREHQVWAGPVVGLIVFGESLAVVGLLIPATALMVLTGSLIGAGTLDPIIVLAWAIGGAIVGDAVSYYIGRWVGSGVTRRWPFNKHRESIARARLFFRKYGLASIFFGRFLGPIRSTIPLVAGTMLMSHRRFQVANVLSAIVWVPALLAPGYLAAKGMAVIDVHSWTGIFAIIVVVSVIGTIVGVRVLRGAARNRPPRRRGIVAERPTGSL